MLSCNFDSSQKSKDMIIGEWQLFNATRNGKSTKILEGTQYKYDRKGIMSSNLFQNQALSYSLKDKQIMQKGDTEVVYDIKKLTTDSLTIGAKIGKYQYTMMFTKMNDKSD